MYDVPTLFQSDNASPSSRALKIVLFGATGNVGRRIASEALDRGYEVIGVVRDPAHTHAPDSRLRLVEGDATDAASVRRVAQGADVVVSAISPRPDPHGLPAPSLASAARALIAGTREAGVRRLVVVGGASTLEVSRGVRLVDTDAVPEAFRPEALEHADALAVFGAEGGDLDWVVLRPAANFHPGERSATYRTTDDELPVDREGQSQISFEDYAVALVDELDQPKHHREAYGVGAAANSDSAGPDETGSSSPPGS
jgi:putative NADH-flavin reductase